ncbi:sulfurtransferase TusA family protein [Acidianus manzaensis]|uniref:UPF0033 domain-containing protein n=1 Tax=Acidianus manzaensis TaxID=282676 RepID=A0A1W6JYA0_9CREN|nr:sulfurtransferase TusA family protein [Acidianus manzaensis]ARM75256.1 hypothetical protein B6F84_03895 [Acidianus manzaensis]
MESEVLNIDFDPSTLLDLERSYKLLSLENVKRLEWGYEGTVKILKNIEFTCFIKKQDNSLKILEPYGKFKITFKINNNKIEINYDGISSLKNILINKIIILIEKYGKYFSKSVKRELKNNINIFKDEAEVLEDIRGLSCPLAEISLLKILENMKTGEKIEVLSDCVASTKIFPIIAKELGFISQAFNMGDYVSFIFLKIKDPKLPDFKVCLKNYKRIALSILKYNKIEKIEEYSKFSQELLYYDKDNITVASPEGRGWFLISYGNEKLKEIRLEYEGLTFFNDAAISVIDGLKGKFRVYRLVSLN